MASDRVCNKIFILSFCAHRGMLVDWRYFVNINRVRFGIRWALENDWENIVALFMKEIYTIQRQGARELYAWRKAFR